MCNIRNEEDPYSFQYAIGGSQHLTQTESSYICNNLHKIDRNKMHNA